MAQLIAIEGIDGSGKGTQAARLAAALKARGFSTALWGFPRYGETFFGARVGEFLNGRFGALEAVHPFLAALLFAGDRLECRGRLQELLANHQFVVLDRYVASNVAHQAAKREGGERRALREWIEHVEFDIHQLPRPDLTVLLDLPADVARKLVARKQPRDYTAAAADLQEADLDYQRRVRELYLELCGERADWRKVGVVDPHGHLRGIEAIGAELEQLVLPPG